MTPPERDPELVVAHLRPNVAVLILPGLVLVALAAATGYLAFRAPETWQRWTVAGTATALAVLLFVLPLWHWASRRYTITTRRTILRDGMLVRHRREVLHSRVADVELRRTPLQSLVGSGDVSISVDGGRPAVLKGMRSPQLVQAALVDLSAAERADRQSRLADSGEV